MRTLRDEWRRMTDAMWQHLYTNQFFRKYGDYRVVEGVLTSVALKDSPCGQTRVWTCIHTDDGTRIDIAPQGDRVKLILPPEEKEAQDALSDAHYKLTVASARADRYEKALREIARPAVEDRNVYSAYHRRTRIAREALDDSA